MFGISRSVVVPGCREAHRHERVEGVVTTGLEPACDGGGMVGEAESVEPR